MFERIVADLWKLTTGNTMFMGCQGLIRSSEVVFIFFFFFFFFLVRIWFGLSVDPTIACSDLCAQNGGKNTEESPLIAGGAVEVLHGNVEIVDQVGIVGSHGTGK